jgi:hypothetical protein
MGKGGMMIPKCKLCQSEAHQFAVVTENSGISYYCSNPDCNMNAVSFTESEWCKLNRTWIKVADELPKESGWYLILRDYKDDYFAYKPDAVYYTADNKGWVTYPKVYAWMPIEKYEGK